MLLWRRSMTKILPSSTLLYKPTAKQTRAITKLAMALGDRGEGPLPIENSPTNRVEARNLIFKLRWQLKEQNNTGTKGE